MTLLDRSRVHVPTLRDSKPLGVCPGLQVINVACGRTLVQDIETGGEEYIKHDYFPTQGHERDYLAHDAEVTPGSRLARIYGSSTIKVNSMHHQGIKTLGEGLEATIHAPDGLIEGLEGNSSDGFLIGVQWHPEMLVDSDAGTHRLFTAFKDSAAQFSFSQPLG